MLKKDNILIGLIPALICPLVVGFGYYISMHEKASFTQLYSITVQYHVFGPLLALGCVINLGLFFLFMKMNRTKAANGVIIATLLYIAITMYYRFLK